MDDMHRVAWWVNSLKGDNSDLICLLAICRSIFPNLLKKAIVLPKRTHKKKKFEWVIQNNNMSEYRYQPSFSYTLTHLTINPKKGKSQTPRLLVHKRQTSFVWINFTKKLNTCKTGVIILAYCRRLKVIKPLETLKLD